jgi:hypothetical protein
MKFLLKIVLALLAILALVLYTHQHPKQTVPLDLFGWPEKPYNEVSASLVMFACFAIGLFVGLITKGGKKSSSGGGGAAKGK